MITGTGLST